MRSITPIVAVIIQARMSSSRLPGKVLMNIAGEPMLGWLVKRVKKASLVHTVIVATSDKIEDDPLAKFCEDNKINCYRGSETNVLQRMIEAAQFYEAEVIVRLTADNPFVSADLVDLILLDFLNLFPNVDYASNTDEGGFPFGLFVEAVKTSSLLHVKQSCPSPDQIEHVTLSFRNNSNSYNVCNVKTELNFGDLLLSVDTIEDYIRVCPLFDQLIKINPHFGLSDITKLVK